VAVRWAGRGSARQFQRAGTGSNWAAGAEPRNHAGASSGGAAARLVRAVL